MEIQNPPERYRLIDLSELMELIGVDDIEKLQQHHRVWVENWLRSNSVRDQSWTTGVAVGSETFVSEIHHLLGYKVKARSVIEDQEKYVLKEPAMSYNVVFGPKKGGLRGENTVF